MYDSPDYSYSVSAERLRELPAEDQLSVMENWFRQRYEDPANRTPYESAEGGYVWIWGGPYEAREVLEEEFGRIVPEHVIERLAETLQGENWEWAPVPREEDYDHSLFDVVSANASALETFREAMATIEDLLAQSVNARVEPALHRLLFANVITALETYLSDTFINTVLNDRSLLRRFLETTPEFQKRNVKYSDVFKAADDAVVEVKAYLLDVVWHNLAKVQAMYQATLGIDFGSGIAAVGRAIPTRHDIVHRNGKTKDGSSVSVTRPDVESLIPQVRSLVDHIDQAYSARSSDASLTEPDESPF